MALNFKEQSYQADQSEETINYWIFPYDSNGHCITSEEELKDICDNCRCYIQSYLISYIWYNEPFSLKLRSGSLGFHISGSVCIGDYIEDEWFLFYLLLELTREFPNLICRIVDGDGEFPLIEAADVLPRWVDSSTAEQRVYLRKGCVHLIPRSLLPLSAGTPSVMDAANLVHSKPSETLASSAVQKAIQLRIQDYPRKISKEHHSTHAYVPVSVAALLQEYPTLVSAAVKAFCNRDASDNKCLRVMRHFPPEMRVMTSVRFSKALYALLSSHSYKPDPCTGWNLPNKNNPTHLIGMKLACGFEILVCRAGGVTPVSTPDEPEVDSFDPKWMKYKQSLTEKGYFRGELEGSALYTNLESNARRFFISNNLMSRGSENDLEALPLGSIIVKLLSKVNVDFETFKKKEKDLLPPDDENWLEMTPDTLEEMLESKFHPGGGGGKSSDRVTADTLNEFLKSTSSFQGAEIPEELLQGLNKEPKPSNRKKSGHSRKASSTGLLSLHPQHRKISSHSNASDASDMSSLSAKVDFNADSFTDALNNILEYSVPEDDYFDDSEDSSGMSSYDEEDDEEATPSRKTSGGSTSSKASSGVDCPPMRPPREKKTPPQRPMRKKKSSSKKIPLAFMDDFDLEDDQENPVKVDMEAVSSLLQAYEGEAGTGPTTALFAALKINQK